MGRSAKDEALLKKEKIRDVADQLFSEFGVGSFSIRMISEHSSMSRAAVYGHSSDKAALIDRLANRSRPVPVACADDGIARLTGFSQRGGTLAG